MCRTPISQAFLQALGVRLRFEVAFLAPFHQLGEPPSLNAGLKDGTEVMLGQQWVGKEGQQEAH